ncbi:Protein extra-macrochaetae [Eumeta japonica]|uniref:Protein extra-macrochaetae n=1 Tax=Eumeta variegata TaxID=151549 RepID=A0A4C1WWI7_EUMVA|nr:Protein extra-macrochaetae [Eumeta japonica]
MKAITAVCATGASVPAVAGGRVQRHRDGENAEIQMYLSKLQDLVPFMPKNRKISKLEVIQHVIDYICDLQSALENHPAVGSFDAEAALAAQPCAAAPPARARARPRRPGPAAGANTILNTPEARPALTHDHTTHHTARRRPWCFCGGHLHISQREKVKAETMAVSQARAPHSMHEDTFTDFRWVLARRVPENGSFDKLKK